MGNHEMQDFSEKIHAESIYYALMQLRAVSREDLVDKPVLLETQMRENSHERIHIQLA